MKYDPSLDGVRAFAVMAVLFFHLPGASGGGLLPGGWIGVDLFFVLSGYLITSILKGELDETGTVRLKRFYLRRVLRLMPAFAALLLVTTVLGALSKSHLDDALQAGFFAATYTMNWYRAFSDGPLWLLGHSWSLAIEEQFYLVWPAALLLIKSKHRTAVVVVLVLAVIAWRFWLLGQGAQPDRIYYGFDTRADALLIGCLLALCPAIFPKHPFATTIAFAVLLLGSLAAVRESAFTQTIGMPVIAIAAAVLIAGLHSGNALRRVFVLPPLVFTGRISYGIYLWHLPVMDVVPTRFPQVSSAALIALSYSAAVASFFVIERPFLKMKSRWDGPRAAAPLPQDLASGATLPDPSQLSDTQQTCQSHPREG